MVIAHDSRWGVHLKRAQPQEARMSFHSITGFIIVATVLCSLLIVTFKDSLTSYPLYLEINIRYIDDLLIVFAYVLMIFDFISSRKTKRGLSKANLLFAMIFTYGVIQTLYLHKSFFANNPLFIIRDNIWYYPMFYFVYKYYEPYKKLWFIGADVFVWVQVMWFILVSIYHTATTKLPLVGDYVNGSLGKGMANVFGFLLLMFLPLLYKRKKKFLIAATVIIFLAASARAAIVLLAFCGGGLILFRVELKKKIIYLAALITIIAPAYILYNTFGTMQLRINKLYEYQNLKLEPGQGAARLTFFVYSIKKLKTQTDWVVGKGIATYASRSGSKLKGELFREFEKDFPFINSFISGGSTLNYWLIEYGIIGSVLLLLFLLHGIKMLSADKFALLMYLVALGGLVSFKLLESYGVGFFWFYLMGIYCGMANERTELMMQSHQGILLQ